MSTVGTSSLFGTPPLPVRRFTVAEYHQMIEMGLLAEFFFSSRRRHTICSRDWSSAVCSSDLYANKPQIITRAIAIPVTTASAVARPAWARAKARLAPATRASITPTVAAMVSAAFHGARRAPRSEEGRVGEECRSRGAADH